MSWIDKILPSGVNRQTGSRRTTVPEGLWKKCIKCEAVLYIPDLERNLEVCPKCDHHMRIGARRRLGAFLDPEGREEILKNIEPIDRLKFRDKKRYRDRLTAAQKSTGERDALIAMRGNLLAMPVVTVAFEFNFHGGSMGYAVGEKFTQAAQVALQERLPLICFSASGGARMQEALISLMQMAKTSAVIERMHSEGIPYISVLTDPIYGGVSASLALLGDVNIAEPDARAGFAGPNIIEQTIRQKLPKGFQRSEFLMEHGAIDMIVPRAELRDTIARLLAKFSGVVLEPELEVDEDAPAAAGDAIAATAAAVVADVAAAEAVPEPAASDDAAAELAAAGEETMEEAVAEIEEAEALADADEGVDELPPETDTEADLSPVDEEGEGEVEGEVEGEGDEGDEDDEDDESDTNPEQAKGDS